MGRRGEEWEDDFDVGMDVGLDCFTRDDSGLLHGMHAQPPDPVKHWTTARGHKMLIVNMSPQHLRNTLNMLWRKHRGQHKAYAALRAELESR